ncbi:hypothetical protein [Phenylobacterium sp.]|uniref:hypothetical protein n=1 Tax=Phenylobacterium sp. TaxID=1871053 RepID=UPI00386211C3
MDLHGGVEDREAFVHGIGDARAVVVLKDANVLGPVIVLRSFGQTFPDQNLKKVVHALPGSLGRVLEPPGGLVVELQGEVAVGHGRRLAPPPAAVNRGLTRRSARLR